MTKERSEPDAQIEAFALLQNERNALRDERDGMLAQIERLKALLESTRAHEVSAQLELIRANVENTSLRSTILSGDFKDVYSEGIMMGQKFTARDRSDFTELCDAAQACLDDFDAWSEAPNKQAHETLRALLAKHLGA